MRRHQGTAPLFPGSGLAELSAPARPEGAGARVPAGAQSLAKSGQRTLRAAFLFWKRTVETTLVISRSLPSALLDCTQPT